MVCEQRIQYEHYIADRFNLALKSVHTSISKLLRGFQTLKYELIKWPIEEECMEIKNGFKKKIRFLSNVILYFIVAEIQFIY